MKRLEILSCGMLALGVILLIGLGTALLAQTNVGRLTIAVTNVVDVPIVDYDKVHVPVAPAEGGEFAVPVVCYCGPAFVLGVEDCGTNALRIQSSRDFTNWAPFPQPGFTLTLATNSRAIIPMDGSNQFFRGISN